MEERVVGTLRKGELWMGELWMGGLWMGELWMGGLWMGGLWMGTAPQTAEKLANSDTTVEERPFRAA